LKDFDFKTKNQRDLEKILKLIDKYNLDECNFFFRTIVILKTMNWDRFVEKSITFKRGSYDRNHYDKIVEMKLNRARREIMIILMRHEKFG
jgi:hypothetical protein